MRETFHSSSVEETLRIGARVAELVRRGGVVALSGDLGTGKTHLAKGICRALGYGGIVSSPTFALIQEYDGDLPIAHVDLYRLESPSQLGPLGLDELMTEGRVMIVEWPELANDILPPSAVRVQCAYGATDRDREFVVEQAQ